MLRTKLSKRNLQFLVICLIVAFASSVVTAQVTPPANTQYVYSGPYAGAPSYTIYQDPVSSLYCAKNAYGVISSSNVNATTVMQYALTNAQAKSVFVTKGTYEIAATLTVGGYTSLVGENVIGTVLKWVGVSHGTVISVNSPWVRLENLYVDCNGLADGISLVNSPDATLNHIVVLGSEGTALYVDTADRLMVKDCSFSADLSNADVTKPLVNLHAGITASVFDSVKTSICREPQISLAIDYSATTSFFGGEYAQIQISQCDGISFYQPDIECFGTNTGIKVINNGGSGGVVSLYNPWIVMSVGTSTCIYAEGSTSMINIFGGTLNGTISYHLYTNNDGANITMFGGWVAPGSTTSGSGITKVNVING
jgi:hypothetical protein